MFVFAVATPALLVVVLGYAVGYAAGAWASDLFGTSSPVVADGAHAGRRWPVAQAGAVTRPYGWGRILVPVSSGARDERTPWNDGTGTTHGCSRPCRRRTSW